MKQWFLDLEHQAVQDSDQGERGSRWGESYDHPQFTTWTEFLDCSAGKGNPGGILQLFWVEELELGVHGGQGAQNSQGRERERAVQRETSRSCRVLLESSVEYWLALACEETMWVRGKNPEKNRGKHLWGSHRIKNSLRIPIRFF